MKKIIALATGMTMGLSLTTAQAADTVTIRAAHDADSTIVACRGTIEVESGSPKKDDQRTNGVTRLKYPWPNVGN